MSARVGEWLFTVALNWAVFVQTQSALLLGVINACRLLPTLILSVQAGHLADRFDRGRLNRYNTVVNAVLTLAVGLALQACLPLWLIAILVVLRAVTTATDGPFRNAYLCGLSDGDQLKSAVAQSASVMNLGRIIGPALAGAMLGATGSFFTFFGAAVTTGLFALCFVDCPAPASPRHECGSPSKPPSIWQSLKRLPEIRRLILLALPVMFFGFPFTAMLPLVTERLLHAGSEQFGTLLAISAAGALLASTQLSFYPGQSTWKGTLLHAWLFGLALLLLSLCQSFSTAAVVLFGVGYFSQTYRTSSRMQFQHLAPKEQAGGLLGLALMDRGMIPLGGLLVGAAAESFGPQVGVSVMGLGCLATVTLFWLAGERKKSIR